MIYTTVMALRNLLCAFALIELTACSSCDVKSIGPDAATGLGDGGVDAKPRPCTLSDLTLKVTTLAGCEQFGTSDGTRTQARFNNPVNMIVHSDGTLIVADFDSERIRKVALDGTVTTVVGPATVTPGQTFRAPFGITLAPNNTLFFETDDTPDAMHSTFTGTIWKLAPGNTAPTPLLTGVGRPRGLLALDNNQLLVADHQHHVIQLVDVSTSPATIRLVAGVYNQSGETDSSTLAATFTEPYNLVRLSNTEFLVTELSGHRIRKLTFPNGFGQPGTVTRFAGKGVAGSNDGTLATATFNGPQAMVRDDAGNIYVSCLGSHTIRKISGDMVSTLAGNGSAGFADSNDLKAAQFFGLEGMAVTPDGATLFVADGTRGEKDLPYNRIRIVRLR
jgi:hypothetical protein